MNINWKLRFQNKTTLTAIVLAVIALVYQVLGIFGIVPAVSQDTIVQLAGAVINLFVLLGIVVDPTTHGVADSERAMGYDTPHKD
jgi:phi LC3 family holin